MSADFLGREAEGDFLLEGVGIDTNGTAGDQVLTAVEVQREGLAFETVGLNRQIEFHLASAESELRGSEIGDPNVGEALCIAHADGEDGHGQGLCSFQSLPIAVGNAVAEKEDAGLFPGFPRGGLKHFQKPRPLILSFQLRDGRRCNGLKGSAETIEM